MKRTFKTVNYEQALDLTVRLGDCLPPEHLARFVEESVALLDLSALSTQYGSCGGEPYARRAWCGVCSSMALPLGSSAHVRVSAPRMRRCHFASSQAIGIPITRRSPRIARTFLPELKDQFGAPCSCSRKRAGVLKLGMISLDGTRAACRCLQVQSGVLQSVAGGGDPITGIPVSFLYHIATSN